MSSVPGQKPALNRAARASRNTRNKLIAAAVVVMSRDGFDGATIAAIAEEADVGFGSFYNHFKSKEEIARAVFDLRSEELQLNLAAIKAAVSDPAEQVSLISRLVIFHAVKDPIWGWFLIRASETAEEYRRIMYERSIATFTQGLEQGRFTFSSPETAAVMVNSTVFGTIRAILNTDLPDRSTRFAVELILSALGLNAEEARKVAETPVPDSLEDDIFDDMRKREIGIG